jgi:hypothetical protein
VPDSDGTVCAVEHKDYARRGAAGSHEWLRGRTMAPSRKAEPAAEPRLPFSTFSWEIQSKGLIMEQLEIIDLGDAMAETRCSFSPGPAFDSLYGPGHWSC